MPAAIYYITSFFDHDAWRPSTSTQRMPRFIKINCRSQSPYKEAECMDVCLAFSPVLGFHCEAFQYQTLGFCCILPVGHKTMKRKTNVDIKHTDPMKCMLL